MATHSSARVRLEGLAAAWAVVGVISPAASATALPATARRVRKRGTALLNGCGGECDSPP